MITSEEVGCDKPNKKNFLFLLNKLNLNHDSYFWMIGDDPEADIFGAKNLGASTFQKIHSRVDLGKNNFQSDYTFKDYWDLLNFLKEFFHNLD